MRHISDDQVATFVAIARNLKTKYGVPDEKIKALERCLEEKNNTLMMCYNQTTTQIVTTIVKKLL